MATQLTKNFTIEELVRSSEAARLKIDNTPDPRIISNLTYLARTVLQPLRDHFSEPIVVSSGFRCLKLNAAIGGSKFSHHVHGCAADIDFNVGSSHETVEIFDHIYNHLPFTELIAEEIGQGQEGWVHVAIARGREAEKQVKYKLRGDKSGVKADKSFEQIMKLLGR